MCPQVSPWKFHLIRSNFILESDLQKVSPTLRYQNNNNNNNTYFEIIATLEISLKVFSKKYFPKRSFSHLPFLPTPWKAITAIAQNPVSKENSLIEDKKKGKKVGMGGGKRKKKNAEKHGERKESTTESRVQLNCNWTFFSVLNSIMALRFMALQPFTVCPFKPRTHGSGWFLPQVLANQRFNKATRVIPPLATVVKHRPFSWQPLSPPPFSFSFSSFSPASDATRGETPLSYLFPFLIFSSPILFLFPPGINPRHQRSFSLSVL